MIGLSFGGHKIGCLLPRSNRTGDLAPRRVTCQAVWREFGRCPRLPTQWRPADCFIVRRRHQAASPRRSRACSAAERKPLRVDPPSTPARLGGRRLAGTGVPAAGLFPTVGAVWSPRAKRLLSSLLLCSLGAEGGPHCAAACLRGICWWRLPPSRASKSAARRFILASPLPLYFFAFFLSLFFNSLSILCNGSSRGYTCSGHWRGDLGRGGKKRRGIPLKCGPPCGEEEDEGKGGLKRKKWREEGPEERK